MKEHMQTVINASFAVFITAFIYQNNSLKDDVETLKGYAQLDTDKAWERMDSIEVELETHLENLETLYNNWDGQDEYNKTVRNVVDNNASQLKAVTTNQNELIDAVANIQEWLEQNFGNE